MQYFNFQSYKYFLKSDSFTSCKQWSTSIVNQIFSVSCCCCDSWSSSVPGLHAAAWRSRLLRHQVIVLSTAASCSPYWTRQSPVWFSPRRLLSWVNAAQAEKSERWAVCCSRRQQRFKSRTSTDLSQGVMHWFLLPSDAFQSQKAWVRRLDSPSPQSCSQSSAEAFRAFWGLFLRMQVVRPAGRRELAGCWRDCCRA